MQSPGNDQFSNLHQSSRKSDNVLTSDRRERAPIHPIERTWFLEGEAHLPSRDKGIPASSLRPSGITPQPGSPSLLRSFRTAQRRSWEFRRLNNATSKERIADTPERIEWGMSVVSPQASRKDGHEPQLESNLSQTESSHPLDSQAIFPSLSHSSTENIYSTSPLRPSSSPSSSRSSTSPTLIQLFVHGLPKFTSSSYLRSAVKRPPEIHNLRESKRLVGNVQTSEEGNQSNHGNYLNGEATSRSSAEGLNNSRLRQSDLLTQRRHHDGHWIEADRGIEAARIKASFGVHHPDYDKYITTPTSSPDIKQSLPLNQTYPLPNHSSYLTPHRNHVTSPPPAHPTTTTTPKPNNDVKEAALHHLMCCVHRHRYWCRVCGNHSIANNYNTNNTADDTPHPDERIPDRAATLHNDSTINTQANDYTQADVAIPSANTSTRHLLYPRDVTTTTAPSYSYSSTSSLSPLPTSHTISSSVAGLRLHSDHRDIVAKAVSRSTAGTKSMTDIVGATLRAPELAFATAAASALHGDFNPPNNPNPSLLSIISPHTTNTRTFHLRYKESNVSSTQTMAAPHRWNGNPTLDVTPQSRADEGGHLCHEQNDIILTESSTDLSSVNASAHSATEVKGDDKKERRSVTAEPQTVIRSLLWELRKSAIEAEEAARQLRVSKTSDQINKTLMGALQAGSGRNTDRFPTILNARENRTKVAQRYNIGAKEWARGDDQDDGSVGSDRGTDESTTLGGETESSWMTSTSDSKVSIIMSTPQKGSTPNISRDNELPSHTNMPSNDEYHSSGHQHADGRNLSTASLPSALSEKMEEDFGHVGQGAGESETQDTAADIKADDRGVEEAMVIELSIDALSSSVLTQKAGNRVAEEGASTGVTSLQKNVVDMDESADHWSTNGMASGYGNSTCDIGDGAERSRLGHDESERSEVGTLPVIETVRTTETTRVVEALGSEANGHDKLNQTRIGDIAGHKDKLTYKGRTLSSLSDVSGSREDNGDSGVQDNSLTVIPSISSHNNLDTSLPAVSDHLENETHAIGAGAKKEGTLSLRPVSLPPRQSPEKSTPHAPSTATPSFTAHWVSGSNRSRQSHPQSSTPFLSSPQSTLPSSSPSARASYVAAEIESAAPRLISSSPPPSNLQTATPLSKTTTPSESLISPHHPSHANMHPNILSSPSDAVPHRSAPTTRRQSALSDPRARLPISSGRESLSTSSFHSAAQVSAFPQPSISPLINSLSLSPTAQANPDQLSSSPQPSLPPPSTGKRVQPVALDRPSPSHTVSSLTPSDKHPWSISQRPPPSPPLMLPTLASTVHVDTPVSTLPSPSTTHLTISPSTSKLSRSSSSSVIPLPVGFASPSPRARPPTPTTHSLHDPSLSSFASLVTSPSTATPTRAYSSLPEGVPDTHQNTTFAPSPSTTLPSSPASTHLTTHFGTLSPTHQTMSTPMSSTQPFYAHSMKADEGTGSVPTPQFCRISHDHADKTGMTEPKPTWKAKEEDEDAKGEQVSHSNALNSPTQEDNHEQQTTWSVEEGREAFFQPLQRQSLQRQFDVVIGGGIVHLAGPDISVADTSLIRPEYRGGLPQSPAIGDGDISKYFVSSEDEVEDVHRTVVSPSLPSKLQQNEATSEPPHLHSTTSLASIHSPMAYPGFSPSQSPLADSRSAVNLEDSADQATLNSSTNPLDRNQDQDSNTNGDAGRSHDDSDRQSGDDDAGEYRLLPNKLDFSELLTW